MALSEKIKDKLKGAALASGILLLTYNTAEIASNIMEIFKINSSLLGVALIALYFFWR